MNRKNFLAATIGVNAVAVLFNGFFTFWYLDNGSAFMTGFHAGLAIINFLVFCITLCSYFDACVQEEYERICKELGC